MLFNLSKWALVAALITTAATSPIASTKNLQARGDLVTTGVRHMSEEEADNIKEEDNQLVYKGDAVSQGKELGNGIYVTTKRDAFASLGKMHGVIKMDEDKFEDVPKVWIPRQAKIDGKDVYLYNNDENIRKYIKDVVKEDPDKSLRMKKEGDVGQFLIPEKLVKELGIKVEGITDDLKKLENVNIDMTKWENQKNKPDGAVEDDDIFNFDWDRRA